MPTITRSNFEAWYGKVLGCLIRDPNAGFIVMITSLALLERYLRQKSNTGEGELGARFYSALADHLALGSEESARRFWDVFRHGLLHQVAFKQPHPHAPGGAVGWFDQDLSTPVVVSERRFGVHPGRFCQRVLDIIEADFPTFEGPTSARHPSPVVDTDSRTTGGSAQSPGFE
jgi:hypothetical protein